MFAASRTARGVGVLGTLERRARGDDTATPATPDDISTDRPSLGTGGASRECARGSRGGGGGAAETGRIIHLFDNTESLLNILGERGERNLYPVHYYIVTWFYPSDQKKKHVLPFPFTFEGIILSHHHQCVGGNRRCRDDRTRGCSRAPSTLVHGPPGRGGCGSGAETWRSVCGPRWCSLDPLFGVCVSPPVYLHSCVGMISIRVSGRKGCVFPS